MVNIANLIVRNEHRWDSMHIRSNRIAGLDAVAKRLVAPGAKAQYQAVEKRTNVPWFVIAVIHERECSQNWMGNQAQGDHWNRVSVHVPAGRGPFKSWEEAAVDALVNCAPRAARWHDWTPGGAMTILEEYNGLGYAAMGVPSSYVWSGSDQYISGKYIRDHVYSRNAVDVQEGCAPLLARMMAMDSSIKFYTGAHAEPDAVHVAAMASNDNEIAFTNTPSVLVA